jgi:hypothetical protein
MPSPLSYKDMIDDRAMPEIPYSGGRGSVSWIKNDFRHRLPCERMRIPAVDRCGDFPMRRTASGLHYQCYIHLATLQHRCHSVANFTRDLPHSGFTAVAS